MSVASEQGRNAVELRCGAIALDAQELDEARRTSNIGKDGPRNLTVRLELYPNA